VAVTQGLCRALKENQTAIYYVAGSDLARLEASPQLEGFRARGIEVLLLPDYVDSFWVTAGLDYEGKPLKSVTQGAADLALIPLSEPEGDSGTASPESLSRLIAAIKTTLGNQVSDVRASERLTESVVCLVAPESGMDRQLERLLARAGQLGSAAKPILEINPRHDLIAALAKVGDDEHALQEDAACLLLDEARILDGELPVDPKEFAQRMARVMRRCLP
jgi:molecular chaperone HtpG